MKPAEKSRRRPSPALAISILALFVALSGTALALQRNSVGPRELKRDAVRSPHIKNRKVKTRDLAPRARVPDTVARVAASNSASSITAHCNAREVATGGGGGVIGAGGEFRGSQPSPIENGAKPTGWVATRSGGDGVIAWVICAKR